MKTCLCLGGADTLFSDIEAYTGPVDGVVACNDAGAHWPGDLDAWVSMHPRYFVTKNWHRDRIRRGYSEPKRILAPPVMEKEVLASPYPLMRRVEFSDQYFPESPGGSSGLFAAKVALIDLGFDLAVLCGIPMTVRPHFWDDKKVDWHVAHQYQRAWTKIPAQYRDRMRSMSGWTRVLLGAPEKGTKA